MRYLVTKELKSQIKLGRFIYFNDLALIGLICLFAYFMRSNVYPPLMIPYAIFTIFISVYLIIPSRKNPGRKNYQSIIICWGRKDIIYKTLGKNVSEKKEISNDKDKGYKKYSSLR